MTPSADKIAEVEQQERDHSPLSGRQRFLRTFSRNHVALASAIYLFLIIFIALFGQWFLVHAPNEINLSRAFEGPSIEHWMGTDHLGRSTLSRIVTATRVAMEAAALGVGIAILLGAPTGLLSGYFGGWWDRIAMRLVEAIIALPALLIAIAIIAVLGPSLTNAMIALGIANSTAFFRLMRGASLEVREELYIDAARVSGASLPRVVFRHVLPNVTGPLTIQTTLAFSFVLLAEAGLSFIGLGVQPPNASWGAMLSTAQAYIYHQPFMVVPPGLMIMSTVLAFNLMGDGLRDAWARVEAHGSVHAGRAARVDVNCTDSPIEHSSSALLDVAGLEVRFPAPRGGELVVVSDVSFAVPPGKTVGLVGESGCGKSVSAMAVMGLLAEGGRISAGSIRFAGKELVGLPDAQLNHIRGVDIGMVFQEPSSSLNPAYTVRNQLAESLRVHEQLTRRQAETRAIELLDHVGIPGAARRAEDYPHQFSGGMAQRVMIAMAIACKPKLLIADEPTTALDVTIQAQVLDLLSTLQEEHQMSILMITHDLGVVSDMCEQAVVMYAGQVIESGDVDRVLNHPQHPYTAGLLASTPQNQKRTGKLRLIPGRVPPAWSWPPGCRFHPRCPYATIACKHPVPMQELGHGHMSRCIRLSEIDLDATW
ncbi:MAG: dipeptide/oligopeptide/nickel ABC transporter permease/ATP-binding protein [Pseudomonadales bacterium]